MFIDFTKKLSLCLLIFLGCSSLQAEEKIHFQSTNKQATLIELFTSQGCSSCPPAERWVNSFLKEEGLWRDFVPVAFHVDYWDYLGWKDIYAQKKFTNRQRTYRISGNLRSVYTPAVLLNGREWRGGSFPEAKAQVGILSGVLENNRLMISYSEQTENLELHIALLGFDIKTNVLRGENANNILPQEFLALAHQKVSKDKASDNRWNIELMKNPRPEIKKVAVAVWVSNKTTMQTVQATGFWL
jgi:hypothetical protein